jgi:hypothetical protein
MQNEKKKWQKGTEAESQKKKDRVFNVYCEQESHYFSHLPNY